MKRRLSFIFFYFVSLILFLEIASRTFLGHTNIWVEDDSTWRRDWISKTKNDDGEKLTYQYYDIYDSTKGWYTKPKIRNMIISYDNKYLNTDSRGIRGTKEFDYLNNSGKKRILILGDSFVFGEEVSDNETFPYYLQQYLPNYQIINMGVHGYGYDQILILYNEEGVKYKPDYVILGFVREDLRRNLLGFRDYAKPKYIIECEKYVVTGIPIPTPAEMINSYKYNLRMLDVFSMLSQKLMEYTGLYNDRIVQISSLLLDELIKKIRDNHSIPVIVYILEYEYEIEPKHDKINESQAFFKLYCDNNDYIDCISMIPNFRISISRGNIPQTRHLGHWDHIGHQIIANSIINFINAKYH